MGRFSTRTGWDLEGNAYGVALAEVRAAGRQLLDLTVSNPTRCGFRYPAEWALGGLGSAAVLRYDPAPRGMALALDAVVGYYADRGVRVTAEQIVLTASTSEAYSYLFKLLCDAGDEVLVARPSYPLFDFLAGLEDVRLVEYPLLYDDGWAIDVGEMERRITPRTRAVVVVHPNNPTGNFVGGVERAALEDICRRHGLALIVDEVFLDYAVGGVTAESFAGWSEGVLSFVLSGISKVCALPQMKASWIVVNGPEGVRLEAMERLEVIADTFLSVSAPVQLALSGWLAGRAGIQEEIRERMRTNLAALGRGVDALLMEGGWTVVVRLPAWGEGGFELAALEAGVVVQPGSFYGLGSGRAVLSLLTPVEEFAAGVKKLRELLVMS